MVPFHSCGPQTLKHGSANLIDNAYSAIQPEHHKDVKK